MIPAHRLPKTLAFKKMNLGAALSRDLLGCGGFRNKFCDRYRTCWRTHPQPNRSRDRLSLALYNR